MNDVSSPGPSSSVRDQAQTNLPVQNDSNDASDAATVENAKKAQRRLKTSYLDHLIRNIDIMIYCELSILYYMDCSMAKFLLRAVPHWFNFTPKPDIIPPVPPGQRPYLSIILGTNAMCMLLHLVLKPPAAGEATRGYLHGGWFMDFVGQASPASKWHLLGMDMLCLALQMLILCVSLQKQNMQGLLDPIAAGSAQSIGATAMTRQNHDAEEAGLLNSAESGMSDEIEMRDLDVQGQAQGPTSPSNATVSSITGEQFVERNRDLAHPLDSFYTGDHMLATLNPYDDLRTQWKLSSALSSPPTTSGVETAATIARRRLALAFGRRAQDVIGQG